ncbi:CDP-diacylglycerol--glycerol-3-phosphate 3-phosphatidyltransferase [Persephonella atlantica]|uniref:CDP-diacylglycerol--glycerol-3-phosphate 3-phosphatidyltransferase n=1 Tax=Persephonella atlantica TaxID=2699429 RepID=A0ABS1GF00_9AQUI|nr:CDP-diacylglycerol--glycerol-3-phosphate 3-phosphatidyltransferase [Persephonella atlantica]
MAHSISLANILTLSRLFITPVLIYCILKDMYAISGILVVTAVLTDWLDGIIARKTNDVTKHGELLDPAVDKIFTISVLVAFVEKNIISSFVIFLVITREMIVTWLRSVMVNKGVVIPASFYGKVKTTFQLLSIFLLSINFTDLGILVLWLSIIIAYYSGFDYFKIFLKKRVWE